MQIWTCESVTRALETLSLLTPRDAPPVLLVYCGSAAQFFALPDVAEWPAGLSSYHDHHCTGAGPLSSASCALCEVRPRVAAPSRVRSGRRRRRQHDLDTKTGLEKSPRSNPELNSPMGRVQQTVERFAEKVEIVFAAAHGDPVISSVVRRILSRVHAPPSSPATSPGPAGTIVVWGLLSWMHNQHESGLGGNDSTSGPANDVDCGVGARDLWTAQTLDATLSVLSQVSGECTVNHDHHHCRSLILVEPAANASFLTDPTHKTLPLTRPHLAHQQQPTISAARVLRAWSSVLSI